ncbi:MAG TPA: M20 family metallopeptidase [Methylomirabilota bacterium]|nr:M20 family metallopeptidase [Methylomirabilota bacterium]
MSALTSALSRIDADELIALTRDLVRIPSVVRRDDPSSTEAAVATHVERWLRQEGFEIEVQAVAPGRPNVLGIVGDGAAGPTLLLEGHTDVVTEGNAADWSHPPFAADLVDGRIYGRGAADMKGGLAAAMIAAAAIKRSGASLAGRLVVGALVDEEGDMLGAKHLCRTPIGRALSAAIICEPEQNELCLEQRGVVWARVTARGRMAHGAMPEAGVNPITALAALVAEAPRLERRLRALCARSRYLRPPTVTPTVIVAPVAGVPQSNVIPAAAQATLDVRLTPGPDADAVAKEIDEACRRAADACPGATVEWQPVNGYRLATRVERSEPLVRAMVGAVRKATGRPARWGGVPGSTDGTILRMELGIPIVTCGPGHRLIPHQVDEYVEVAELVDAAKIYAAAVLAYLKP